MCIRDRNSPARSQWDSSLHRRSVVERAIRGAEILQEILVAFAAHFRMHARSKGIGHAQIVASRTAQGYAQTAEGKMVGRSVGKSYDQFSHSGSQVLLGWLLKCAAVTDYYRASNQIVQGASTFAQGGEQEA